MRTTTHIIISLFLGLSVCVLAEQKPKQTLAQVTTNLIHWGANIHNGGTNPSNVAVKLAGRNLQYVRMDLASDAASIAKFVNSAKYMQSQNIKIQAIVYSSYTNPVYLDTDLKVVEKSVYDKIVPTIINSKDYVSEYELQNEMPLYTNFPLKLSGTTGQNATDFNTPAALLQAAVLRGLSRAIDSLRTVYSLPIRIILGTVDRQFGFITFMQQQGVLFDIVGYHIYPWETDKPLDQDTWFGDGGPLGQLAKFNKPIHINEFNSGEIYSGYSSRPGSNYENKPGGAVTEAGYRSLYKHLNEIVNQKVANVEEVCFYEAFDEIHKSAPENRFGLYYDEAMVKPKISLLLASAYAGGVLSQAEQDSLTIRNLMPNATGINEITIQSKGSSVYGLKNQIISSFEGAALIELFTLTGQLLHKETATRKFSYSVASGIYLLRLNGEAHKVVVR